MSGANSAEGKSIRIYASMLNLRRLSGPELCAVMLIKFLSGSHILHLWDSVSKRAVGGQVYEHSTTQPLKNQYNTVTACVIQWGMNGVYCYSIQSFTLGCCSYKNLVLHLCFPVMIFIHKTTLIYLKLRQLWVGPWQESSSLFRRGVSAREAEDEALNSGGGKVTLRAAACGSAGQVNSLVVVCLGKKNPNQLRDLLIRF